MKLRYGNERVFWANMFHDMICVVSDLSSISDAEIVQRRRWSVSFLEKKGASQHLPLTCATKSSKMSTLM